MNEEFLKERLDPKSVPSSVRDVLHVLQKAGYESWLVGGGVRDLLRSNDARLPKDWDIATSALPNPVMRLFKRVIPSGIKHGTVTVLTKGHPVEVTTFRGEIGYSDCRRPDKVEFLDRVEDDLARRDFTINAIAWNPLSGEVRDPFGGIKDLQIGLIRAVRDPLERFTEDGLRPMRGIRFSCVLELDLEPKTLAAIPLAFDSFTKVAVERIRVEFEKILLARQPSIGFNLLRSTGLLIRVIPALLDLEAKRWDDLMSVLDKSPARMELRLAIIFSSCREIFDNAAKTVRKNLTDLRFPNATTVRVVSLFSMGDWKKYYPPKPPVLRRVLAKVGITHSTDLGELWPALASEEGLDCLKRAEEVSSLLQQEASLRPPLENSELALSGKDIMDLLSIPPGRLVGEAMSYLMEIVLDDPSANTPAKLRSELINWSKNQKTQ